MKMAKLSQKASQGLKRPLETLLLVKIPIALIIKNKGLKTQNRRPFFY